MITWIQRVINPVPNRSNYENNNNNILSISKRYYIRVTDPETLVLFTDNCRQLSWKLSLFHSNSLSVWCPLKSSYWKQLMYILATSCHQRLVTRRFYSDLKQPFSESNGIFCNFQWPLMKIYLLMRSSLDTLVSNLLFSNTL